MIIFMMYIIVFGGLEHRQDTHGAAWRWWTIQIKMGNVMELKNKTKNKGRYDGVRTK